MTARVRVMSWRGIPSQVRATDATGASASRMLPDRWQQEIDRVAIREGLAGTDDYLELWAWSAETVHDGSAEEAVDATLAALVAAGPPRAVRR